MKSDIWLRDAQFRVRRLANKGKWKILEHRQSPVSESAYFTLEKQKRVVSVRVSCHGGTRAHLEPDNFSIVYPRAAGPFDRTLDDLMMVLCPPKKKRARKGTKASEPPSDDVVRTAPQT